MGAPPLVLNDRVTGQCVGHQIPGPLGVPTPAPPLPFAAPLTLGLAATVTIGGKPVALVGSSGFNTPPHVGLHATDPFMVPTLQVGRIVSGSGTVLVEKKPVATQQSSCLMCMGPGQAVPSVSNVLIG